MAVRRAIREDDRMPTIDAVGRPDRARVGAKTSLVSTKLTPPVPRALVPRPHLIERLLAGSDRRATLISAPAGAGKTSLLAEWAGADSDGRNVAWVTLDRDDNDPVRFWTYVLAALAGAGLRADVDVDAALRTPGVDVATRVLAPVINAAADSPVPVAVVLDDYHVVADPAIHRALTSFIDLAPPQLHVVISSRSDPPLPRSRLLAHGELHEVRAADLRFTDAEARDLLNGLLGLDLRGADVSRLVSRTEGWAAGLYMAALSLRGRSDPQAFIARFAGDDRHVVDYLASEVLGGADEDVRTFMRRTSVLERVSADLCDTILEARGSAEMLERIERSNLFLVPLDTTREWYRFHGLFRDLLSHELSRTEPELIATLHTRAGRWRQEQGDLAAAIRHFTAAGQFGQAAELIVDGWVTYLQRGQVSRVRSWLEALPDEVVTNDPRLSLIGAWTAINVGRLDEVDQRVRAAQERISAAPRETAVAVESGAVMLRCIHEYMSGDVGNAVGAARASHELESGDASPWRSVGCPVLGVALFWGDEADEADSVLARSAEIAGPAGNTIALVHGMGCRAAIRAESGRTEEAAELARAVVALGHEHGLTEHWTNAMARVAAAKTLAGEGRLDEAAARAEAALDVSRRGLARVETAYSLIALAEIRHQRGDREAARDALAAARKAVAACPDPGILAQMLTRAERRLARPRRPAGDHLRDELTERELTLLRLLPSDLPMRAIAAQMYVSLNTTKTHAKSVYRKLGADSRADAVTRARDLDLL
jgi:ATP/maltotriose-dependent transcriptional regulator MalT